MSQTWLEFMAYQNKAEHAQHFEVAVTDTDCSRAHNTGGVGPHELDLDRFSAHAVSILQELAEMAHELGVLRVDCQGQIPPTLC